MYKYTEIVEERVIKKMDPILTIGLLAFVFVVSFLIVLSFKGTINQTTLRKSGRFLIKNLGYVVFLKTARFFLILYLYYFHYIYYNNTTFLQLNHSNFNF